MKRDNRNRRQRAAPGFKLSKHLTKTSAGKPKNGGVGVVYVGPSVEGGDKEYVKVLTGDVDLRKPSFV